MSSCCPQGLLSGRWWQFLSTTLMLAPFKIEYASTQGWDPQRNQSTVMLQKTGESFQEASVRRKEGWQEEEGCTGSSSLKMSRHLQKYLKETWSCPAAFGLCLFKASPVYAGTDFTHPPQPGKTALFSPFAGHITYLG